MPKFTSISRRTCLKGLGVAIALPLLETMSWGETPKAIKNPVRMAFLQSPFGCHPDSFWPKDAKTFGPSGVVPPTLEPLRALLGDCLVIQGLQNPGVNSTKASTHLVETSGWLTCTPAKGGGMVEVGVSADQIAAMQIGAYTAIPSLELGIQSSNFSHSGEDGFAGAYYDTISYRTPTQPIPCENNPKSVLNRLFSSRKSMPKRHASSGGGTAAIGGGAEEGDGPSLDQSMLDVVMESTTSLRTHISGQDKRIIDEYLDGVRSLEKRVAAIEKQQAEAARAKQTKGNPKNGLKYSDPIEVAVKEGGKWSEHVKVMGDLMILAFQTDLTRIATLVFEHPFGVSYPELGFTEGHHDCSHHDNKPEKLEKLLKIEKFQIEQLAYIISRMKTLLDGNGTLLDNSMVLWGSGMGYGFQHSNNNLPTILAGRGGGSIRTGRLVHATGNQGDLLMAILARAGCAPDRVIGSGTKPSNDLT
ncbi:MAG TPA: DUF1552 domain-containing protein [Planctomycetota bacterium]|nr:DUF1552 domain-containing protein [Planctomycetota bacterium]